MEETNVMFRNKVVEHYVTNIGKYWQYVGSDKLWQEGRG
jgi:hypothetical protein